MESNQLLNQMKDLNKNLARIDRHLADIVKALTVPRTPRCSGRYPWPKIEDSLGFIDFNSNQILSDEEKE